MNWDAENCGARNVVCEAGRTCEAGICVTEELAAARVAEAASASDGPVALLASGTWTERTPGIAVPADGIGGRLTGVAPDLGDSTRARILVGSPGGGFWRRDTETGNWYRPTTSGGADHTIMHLEWDYDWSASPRRLWMATWNSLQYTTDLGVSWTSVLGGSPSQALLPTKAATGITVRDPRPFAQLRFSTTSSQRAIFFSYGCQGIYYSFGTTFLRFWPFVPQNENNPQNCIGAIAADPATKQVYFTSLHGAPAQANLVYSTGPWAWNVPNTTIYSANGALPIGGRMAALLTAPQPSPVTNRMMATTNDTAGDGNHWVSIATKNAGLWEQQSISFAGQHQGRVLAWGGIDDRGCYTNATGSDPTCNVTTPTSAVNEVFEGNQTSWRSPDFGASWVPVPLAVGTKEAGQNYVGNLIAA